MDLLQDAAIESGIYGHGFRVRINPFVAACLQIGHFTVTYAFLRVRRRESLCRRWQNSWLHRHTSVYRDPVPPVQGYPLPKAAVAACRRTSTRILVSVFISCCYKWIFRQKNRNINSAEDAACGKANLFFVHFVLRLKT